MASNAEMVLFDRVIMRKFNATNLDIVLIILLDERTYRMFRDLVRSYNNQCIYGSDKLCYVGPHGIVYDHGKEWQQWRDILQNYWVGVQY